MDNFWCLSNINLYKILCPTKLKDYRRNNANIYKKEEVIYSDNQSDNKVYLIAKGKVKLVNINGKGDEIVYVILKKGEIFGEKAILVQGKRGEFAIAESNDTQLCPLSVDKMYALMRKNENFGSYIYKLIGMRIKKIERRLEILFYKDVRTRLVEFIHDLLDEHNAELVEGEVELGHVFTQDDIAKLIGSSRETITKTMNQLKREKLIEYKRGWIKILDVSAFKELAI